MLLNDAVSVNRLLMFSSESYMGDYERRIRN